MANNSGDFVTLDPIIGLPPSTYVSDTEILNSMPILYITPQKPQIATGSTVFQLINAIQEYSNIVHDLNYGVSLPLKVAFQADSLPTDTFSNDYTETFLQKFTDVASQGISQIMQMTGADTFAGGVANLGGGFSQMGAETGGALGAILKGAGGVAQTTATELNSIKAALEKSGNANANLAGGALNTINKMLAGQRVDYPKVWGNSAYSSAFSITIKLYNPNPGNPNSTSKYIIGPLAAILSLATPRTGDGYSYNWPFFHKIEAPGFFRLDPAVITNITVTKGGDHQQLAFTKTLGMVDVRMDFTSLFDTMVLEEPNTPNIVSRPTVRNYLETLNFNKHSSGVTKRADLRTASANAAGVSSTPGTGVRRTTFQDPQSSSTKLSAASNTTKNLATSKMLPSTLSISTITEGVTGRVPTDLTAVSRANVNLNREFISAKIPDIPPF